MLNGFEADRFSRTVEMTAAEHLAVTSASGFARVADAVSGLAEEECRNRVGDDDKIACRAGCSHCCIVNVAVLAPEADAIAGFIVETRSGNEVEAILARLAQLEIETRWLDDEERIMVRRPCAFLDPEGSCSIYPVRPLLCRSLTSLNADDCREALSMVAMDEHHPILSNLLQKEIFETAFDGLGRALEQNGIDHRSHRLTASVRARLEKLTKQKQGKK